VHYDEAVLIQKLRRKNVVTERVLVDSFLEVFPYGSSLFNMTWNQYIKHVENNISVILDLVIPHGIKVIDERLQSGSVPGVPYRHPYVQPVLHARETT